MSEEEQGKCSRLGNGVEKAMKIGLLGHEGQVTRSEGVVVVGGGYKVDNLEYQTPIWTLPFGHGGSLSSGLAVRV